MENYPIAILNMHVAEFVFARIHKNMNTFSLGESESWSVSKALKVPSGRSQSTYHTLY